MKKFLLRLNTKRIGYQLSKFGLVLILLWLGVYKFTPTETAAIKPLIENSPLFSWQLSFLSMATISKIIGAIEILVAILIMLDFKFKRLAQIGYLIGTCMFLSTLSFIFTTPAMFVKSDGIWVTEFFIVKDLLLLGFCIYNLNFKKLFGTDD
ncbi:MAG: DUF417 family protein [Chitinophagaceae bacterium]